LDFTEHEDAASKHKNAKTGTADSCTLPCERGLPKIAADGADLVAYQQQRTAKLAGGFDPCSLTR